MKTKITNVADYTSLRSYRYERKFLVDDLQIGQVKSIIHLHPRMFRVTYPPRFVNNLYLDTSDLENYYDNINGAAERRKVRIRWYGESFGMVQHPVLEIKLKKGLVGTKYDYPLNPFYIDRGFNHLRLMAAVKASNLPENVRQDLLCQQSTLLNRYYRYYYASYDGIFRVTLDSAMTFFKANDAITNSFRHHQTNQRQLVVELKYDVDQDQTANRVTSYLPFRVTRNSKYVEGIERVYF